MAARRDPKFKPRKVVPYTRPGYARPLPRNDEFRRAASAYQYSEGQDRREIREPVTLAEFIARKSKPGWKPAKVRGESAPPRLTAKSRQGVREFENMAQDARRRIQSRNESGIQGIVDQIHGARVLGRISQEGAASQVTEIRAGVLA
jgi:hypothetical protein